MSFRYCVALSLSELSQSCQCVFVCLQTLLVKVCGVIFSVVGGLAVGKVRQKQTGSAVPLQIRLSYCIACIDYLYFIESI